MKFEDTFWMVYGGHCSGPTYRHQSYGDAIKEAERLCGVHGKEFYVLQARTKVEKVQPFTHTDMGEMPF